MIKFSDVKLSFMHNRQLVNRLIEQIKNFNTSKNRLSHAINRMDTSDLKRSTDQFNNNLNPIIDNI